MVNEYRFFVANGIVCTGSTYIESGRYVGDESDALCEGHPAWQFAQNVVDSSSGLIPPGVVVDVASLESGEYCLIEFNPAWASGIYGSDPLRALKSIELSCCRRDVVDSELLRYEIF
jgi:hypothetical protein